MAKSGLIEHIRRGAAQRVGAAARCVPAPVRRGLGRLGALIERRRRSVSILAIVGLHLGILACLAIFPPQQPPQSVIFLDLSPIEGHGGGSAIDAAPTPPPATTAPPSKARIEAQSTKPQTKSDPAKAPPDTTDPDANPAKPVVDAAKATPPADQNADAADAQAEPQPSDADVLALVEQLTGTKASSIAEPVPPLSTVSSVAMDALRQQQFRTQAGRPGAGCAIDYELKQRLSSDPAVQAALAAIPTTDRSVSNALQLWDGRWTTTGLPGTADAKSAPSTAQDALAPVRALAIATVASAPGACRNAALKGPRFIIVPVQGQAEMVVVIGSGDWRWRDLLPVPPRRLFGWFGL